MFSQSSEPKLLPKTKHHHNLYNSEKTQKLRRQKLKIHVSKFEQLEHSQQLYPNNHCHQYSSEGQKNDILKTRYKLNKGQSFSKIDLKGILQMHFTRQKKQELKKSYFNNGYKNQGYSIGFQKKVGLDMIIPSFQAFNINSDRLPGFTDPLEKDNSRSLSKNKKNDRPKSNTRQIRGIKGQEDKKYCRQRSETRRELKQTQTQQQKQERYERERQQFTLKSFGTQIFWNKKKEISKQLYSQFSMYEKKQQTKFRSKNIENIIRRKANRSFFQSFSQYCSRMKVSQNSKVFVFQSSDVWLKQVLLERGWVQNLDPASKFYHLKWVNKIPLQRAEKQQLVNHFYDSDKLTSKVNLAKTIKQSKHLQKYAPRTYELGHQTSQFVVNYNRTQILSGFKLIVKQIQKSKLVPQNIIPKQKLKDRLIKLIQCQEFQQSLQIQEFVIHIPYAIQLCAFCQNLRCEGEKQQKQPNLELTQKSLKNLSNFSHLTPPYIQYINLSSTETKEKKEDKIKMNKKNINMYSSVSSFKSPSRQLLGIIYSYHKYLCAEYKTYEAEGSQNIWIVKNRNSSRGGGISIHNNIQDILKKTDNKIVQKYLQNCALFGEKNKGKQIKYYKYDLRVWVLVTSFSPLISYYYNKFYCRLCSEEYDTKNISKLESHLTNYSKNRQNFTKDRCSVLSYQQFINLAMGHEIKKVQLQKEIREEVEEQFQNKEDYQSIKQKIMKKVDQKLQLLIFHTLNMYQDRIESCPECFQLYGFDILVSDTFEFYLIEVNLSPACEDRDEWLSQNARRMARGMINIVAQHQKPQDSRFQGWSLIKQI